MRVTALAAAIIAGLMTVGSATATPLYDRDTRCLASTMWGEARGDGEVAMLAVADVVLNRAEQSGKSVCALVRARSQFDGHGKKAPAHVVALARRAMAGDGRGITSGSLYFTAAWDRPRWARKLVRVGQLGGNVYFKGEWKP